ncbi:uncharacterized protein RB166_009672 [Leptodactylus fuscus]
MTTMTATSQISTATTGATTAISAISTVPLEFRIVNKNFTDDLKNTSSPEFNNLKANVENTLTKVYKEKFNNFKSVNVSEFRPGSVIAVTSLEFNTSTTPAPSNNNTVEALVSSLQSNNSIGDFQIAPESIKTIAVSSDCPFFRLRITNVIHVLSMLFYHEHRPQAECFKIINQNFSDDLKNKSSSRFTTLKSDVEKTLTDVYKAKFDKFRTVTVTEFQQGSVIALTKLVFENSTIAAPSNDDIVRSLVSSLQSNGSLNDLEIQDSSINASGITVSNLAPINISVSFLIKEPYSASGQGVLEIKAKEWVNKTLLLLPNTTSAGNSTVSFMNINGWTNTTVVSPISTPFFFDVNTTLSNFISQRNTVNFAIVPSSLMVQGKSLTFNIISSSLRILQLSQSPDLSDKSSTTFQKYSQAIENSNFSARNVTLDLLVLQPAVGVKVTATLLQYYTSSLSNASSSDATQLQNTVLSLLTPELRKYYSNSLQDPPSVSFTSDSGFAAAVIEYKQNYTTFVESSSVLTGLLANTNLTNILRIASLSVNDTKSQFAVYRLKPRFTNQDFGADLNNRESPRFKALANNITQVFTDVFNRNNLNVKQVSVLSFQPGSVIGEIETSFPTTVASSSDLTQAILNNKDVFDSKNLALDTQSIYPIVPAPTSPPYSSSVPGYGVAIIVMCILLILAIPLIIFLALKTTVCQKLSNACSLKSPYDPCRGVDIRPTFTSYKTHSYDLTR